MKQSLFNFLIPFLIVEYLHWKKMNIEWSILYALCLSFYEIYRGSILFQKYRILNDKRYFITQTKDLKSKTNNLVIGGVFILLSFLFYWTKSSLPIEEHTSDIITICLIIASFSSCSSFFKNAPSFEVQFTEYYIKIYNDGGVINKFDKLSHFEVDKTYLTLTRIQDPIKFEKLIISEDQQIFLQKEIETFAKKWEKLL